MGARGLPDGRCQVEAWLGEDMGHKLPPNRLLLFSGVETMLHFEVNKMDSAGRGWAELKGCGIQGA